MISSPPAPPRPDAVARRPASVSAPPPAVRAPVAPRRDPYGRALRWAVLLSVAAHAAVLLLTGEFLRIEPMESPQRTAQRADTFTGLEWVTPVTEGAEGDSPPAASEADPADAAPAEIPRVLRVRPGAGQPQQTPPPAAPTPGGAPGGQGSARDALRPGYRDPRLYVAPDPLGLRREQQSEHEQYMDHLQARIDAVNDSMGAAAAREKAAKDWTFRDKDGRRWGLSDEGLHLGPITVPPALVPMPRSTGDNMTRERIEEEQRQRDEIRRQEETRTRADTMRARSRATRERNDAARPPGGG